VRAAIEEIEALVGDEKVQLRLDARIPVGKDGATLTLDELRRSPLLMRDYTQKTQEIAAERRAMEREAAEMRARAELYRANRTRLLEARQQGGEALEKEIQHQELLETNPDYRKRFEESEEFRVQQAIQSHEVEVRTHDHAASAADEARDYIRQACQQHPELDPADVEELYARALSTGRAELKPSSVDRIIQRELQRVGRVTQPLQEQLKALQAELGTLKAQHAAAASNATVSAAIDRAKAPAVGRPAAGGVPVTPARKPFNPDTDNPQAFRQQWLSGH